MNTPYQSRLIPATKWNEYHPWPTIGGIRHLLFNRKTNGFTHCIRKIGRKVLIDEAKFFEWVEHYNQTQQSHQQRGTY